MTLMKEERRRRRRRRRRRKKTILGVGDPRSTDFLSSKNISRKPSLCPPFLSAIGSARNQKKSSQSKRTFHSLRQNTNCIGHTLRRVWGRKRRKRERNARVFLSSSQRERESLFVAPSIVSQRRDLNRMII